MVDQAKNFMIGIFVVAAISLIVFIILFIHPTVGNEGKVLKVRFSNIDKVNVGTRVTFGGRPVGEVVSIREIENEAAPRAAHGGVVYVYELTLAVDTSVDVFNSDEISLRTSGLLGDKSVNITPLPPRQGQKLRPVEPQEVIYAYEGASVEDTLRDFRRLAEKIGDTLDGIISLIEDVDESKLISNLSDTFANTKNITGSLNEPEKWRNILSNVEDVTASAVESWPKVDETLDSMIVAADNAKVLTEDGKEIALNIREGRGTVGRALMREDLYLQMTSLFSKGETVMNDINHYGILFHLDKNWQRLRARRYNLMQKLCSPQEFRNFFNDEIDQINTSLSRVNMIVEESGLSPCDPCLSTNFEFNKVFAELLRRTEEIEENLKLYNIQLNDCRVRETEFYESCGY